MLFIAIFAEVTENECVTENQRQITYPNIYILNVQRGSFPYWEFGYGKFRLTLSIMELCFRYIISVNCVNGV